MRVRVLLVLVAMLTGGVAVASNGSFIAVPRVTNHPVIDGDVGTGEWSGAATTCGLRDIGTGYPSRAEMTTSICYNSEGLWCLMDCIGEAPEKLVGASGERDSDIWSESLVEMFVAPASWPMASYGHFMVSHAGVIADEMCDAEGKDLGWNPDWKSAATKTPTGYRVEMMVPWKSLGLSEPETGAVFRVNFARNAASVPALVSWADVQGGFHQPARFGTMALVGEAPVVSMATLPGRRSGPVSLDASLTGLSKGARLVATVTGKQTRTFSALFSDSSAGSARATLPFVIAGGTSAIAVTVREGSGRVLWSQVETVDVPDLSPRLRELRSQLRQIPDGTLSPSDISATEAQLTALDAKLAEPLDAAGLAEVSEAAERIGRRVSDIVLLTQSAAGGRPGEALPAYYVTNPVSTLKVQPTSTQAGPLAHELRIAMARGEYEPVQIAVCAVGEDLQGLRVSASSLRGPSGARIPRERVVITPLGWVQCEISTPGARLKGQIPDVLLPNRVMSLPAGARQPFLITVQTTAADVPGEYRGSVRVTDGNGARTRLPLVVRVYPATIPTKSYLRTAFVLWGSYRPFLESTAPSAYIDTYIRYSKVMLANRISPITMWPPKKNEAGQWDFADYDRLLTDLVPEGLTTMNIGGNGTVAGSRNTDFAAAAAKHFKTRGGWDLHYVYGWDEAPGNVRDQLKTNYQALIDAVPDIKVMQTGWSPSAELKGLVRIWCPLTASTNLAGVREAQETGDEVWWYVCCGPTAPFANLFVDYPGIDHRMLGWQTFSSGIEGFLYWGVDVWPGNQQTVDDYDHTNYSTWRANSFGTCNGDGYLLYPGKHDEPLSSLRLALLRDGFEDFDLFTEARALADTSGKAGARLTRLLEFDAPLITSLTEYTQDGNDLLARREEILRAMQQVQASASQTRE